MTKREFESIDGIFNNEEIALEKNDNNWEIVGLGKDECKKLLGLNPNIKIVLRSNLLNEDSDVNISEINWRDSLKKEIDFFTWKLKNEDEMIASSFHEFGSNIYSKICSKLGIKKDNKLGESFNRWTNNETKITTEIEKFLKENIKISKEVINNIEYAKNIVFLKEENILKRLNIIRGYIGLKERNVNKNNIYSL
ncbi:MAG: hypothetical protein ACRC4M_01125 [Mycoplasma sp.]